MTTEQCERFDRGARLGLNPARHELPRPRRARTHRLPDGRAVAPPVRQHRHLVAGRWIGQQRRVPSLDPLSYTASDHAWINVQWLFDVVTYALHQIGGPSLLVVVSALAYSAAVALMLLNIRRHADAVTTAVL